MRGSYARVFDDDDVLKLLHARVKSAGGQTAFSKKTGVERSHLNTVLNGRRPLTSSILNALNLRIVYAPVGRRPFIAGASRTTTDH
jgi:DNA-binding phage protein